MTKALFIDDSYLTEFQTCVAHVNERGGIVLEESAFYAAGGGQPGDSGKLVVHGNEIPIATTVKGDQPDEIVLVPAEPAGGLNPGDPVTGVVDWSRRHRLMRVHTALHLLSVVLPFPVTGGQISEDGGRLDFNIEESGQDKEALTAELQALIDADHPVSTEWITDADLDANPGLVKTMSVMPPRGSGTIRLVRIGEIDLQPCGGTHVRSTSEIGCATITKIEKKGRQNRRVRIALQN